MTGGPADAQGRMSGTMSEQETIRRVASWAAAARGRNWPASVMEAARACLLDTLGVTLGARDEPGGKAVRRVVEGWRAEGRARIAHGGTTCAAGAALVNGTFAHCLDYDDTHVGATAHLSAPVWSATLAVGQQTGAEGRDMLAAFIAGFESGARLGKGIGEAANLRGWHSTGIFGALGAAVAAAVLLRLDEDGIARALGAAATQAGGLTGSFGTHSKPFHAGKAAMNGVLAAELAAAGFEASQSLLDAEDGLASALVQDGAASIGDVDFDDGWELLRNTVKPYAACLLTHPVIDAARALAPEAAGRTPERIELRVNPAAIRLAGKADPRTPLEGKFSLAFCTALGLAGRPAVEGDFTAETLADPALRAMLARVEPVAEPGRDTRSAALEVRWFDGATDRRETALARGNPGNPLSRADLEAKFRSLAEPALGDAAETLSALAWDFDTPGRAAELHSLLAAQEAARP